MTETNGTPVVRASGLTMRFGTVQALENVSFEVRKGEILGLLGRNGAGKTTTMRILTTYLIPTAGSATVAGCDVLEQPLDVRKRIGYLPESVPVYPEMEAVEYLIFVGRGRDLSGETLKSRLDWTVQACDIGAVLKRPIGELSKGYKQRVAIAQALIHDPEILILDEPTSGLDPIQIRGVRNLIRELSKEKTIIFSTHNLREIELMTERVVIIDGGHVVADGSSEEISRKRGLKKRVRVLLSECSDRAPVEEVLKEMGTVEGEGAEFRLEVDEAAVPELLERIAKSGWKLADLRIQEPSLEEAFVSMVKPE